MCNINILLRKEKTKEEVINNISAFLMSVTAVSYTNNSDGDGLYNSDILIRNKNKINLLEFDNAIKRNWLNITHQRIATSGFSETYLQPFVNEDFVLVHNGIINDFIRAESSDTYGFFNNFQTEFLGYLKTHKRKKAIVKAIKKLLDKLYFASYSIAILDKKTQLLYYFKNNRTNIYFYKSKEFLFITTAYNNAIFLNLLEGKFKEIKIQNNIIYEINKSLNINPAGAVENSIYNESEDADINLNNYFSYNYKQNDYKEKIIIEDLG